MEAHGPTFGWRQGGGAGGMGLLPQTGILPLGAPSSTPARKFPLENPNSAMVMVICGCVCCGFYQCSSVEYLESNVNRSSSVNVNVSHLGRDENLCVCVWSGVKSVGVNVCKK